MPRKKQNTDNSNASDDSTAQVADLPVYKTEESDLVDANSVDNAGKRPVHIHVTVRKGESVEQMLRRFNYAVTKSELITKLRDLQFYEKPSKRRQREEKMRMAQRHHYDD